MAVDPLPAPDAPQVERFHPKRDKDADRAYMDAGKKGDWVRYTDYATLEAEKQQLEDENRKLTEANMSVAVCSLHVVDITHDGDCHVCDAIIANERAEAAESSLATLRDAVREFLKALKRFDLARYQMLSGPRPIPKETWSELGAAETELYRAGLPLRDPQGET